MSTDHVEGAIARACPTGGLSGHVHPDFAALEAALRRQIAARPGSGAALCVFHRGECVVDLWGGVRDRAGRPWERDTLVLSFSTTKGIVATLLHVLADRGALGYDEAVSAYWPEFRGDGKERITVRQLLGHQAGLWDMRSLVDDARCMLDWEDMIERLEGAVPAHAPGDRHAYHGLTWGWLVGELIQRVTRRPLGELVEGELARPLELDGLFIGRVPAHEWRRRATLVERRMGRAAVDAARRSATRVGGRARSEAGLFDLDTLEAALLPPGIDALDWNSDEIVSACIPAANGFFTARSLARVYAVLAAGGEHGGVKLLSARTLARWTAPPSGAPFLRTGTPMQWQLGYHRVPVPGSPRLQPFGHFGFGGSGAWADPSRELAVACTLNTGAQTPFGDTRLLRLGVLAARAADRR